MNNVNSSGSRTIEFISSASRVNMGDAWYDYASPDHFWMRRRFDVFSRLSPPHCTGRWVEVGCGNGAVQLQMNQRFDIDIDGIELNEAALQQNISQRGRLLCYDVFDRNPSLHQAWDHLILFDVLEHIEDHRAFLESVLFLLQPGGKLIINVPAFPHLWSAYDEAQEHVRRYRMGDLQQVVDQVPGVSLQRWTYWGGPFVPLLAARKLRLKFTRRENVIQAGFAVPGQGVNAALRQLARLEWIPQHFYGTSLMAVLQKQPQSADV